MGKIKFSAIVSAASGKIGGNVFARNASGAYVRTWANPVNPNTTKQQSVRTSFANLVSAWKNLSEANQQAWQDMAPQYPYTDRLGETKQYTGQQLYIKLNQNLAVVGTSALSTPLVPQTFTSIGIDNIDFDLTAGVLTTGEVEFSQQGASTEAFIIEVTTSLSGGITKPAKGLFRQVKVVADASASNLIDCITDYQALYGNPELGAKLFVRAALVNKNTGQRLNLGQKSTVVSGT